MSNAEMKSNEQMDANYTQGQTKTGTEKNGAERQRAGLKVKSKSVPKQTTVGDPRIAPLKENLMKEILTYKDTLPQQQSDETSVSICLKDCGGQNDLLTSQHFSLVMNLLL